MSGLLGGGSSPTNAPIIYSGLSVSTSQWNMPVPLFWGTRRLSTNALAYTNFQKHKASGKGGGKGGGGKGGQNYTYSADVLQSLGEGPIDAIQNIWANGSTTTTTTLSDLNMTFFSGTAGQAPWSYWSSNYPSMTLSYSQTAYLGAPNLDLGESATIPDNGFECVRTSIFAYSRTSTVAGWINPNSHAQSTASDVLLSDCITDLLTNPQYGMGWTAGDLGSIAQFAAYQRAQGIFVSPLLNSQEKATDVLDRWAQIGNSWIFWSGVALEFLPLADTVITGNGVTFAPQNDVAYALAISDLVTAPNEPPVKITRKDPADCYNRATVDICDRTLGYIDNPIQWHDDNLIDSFGLRDATSVSADEICDPAVGAIVVQLVGKRAAYVRNTYEFKTSFRFIRCLPGTVLTIPLNFSGMSVRVRITDVGQDAKGVMSFTAEEFPGTVGTFVAPLSAPAITTSQFPNAYAAPSTTNTPAVIEPPASFTGGAAKIIVAASGDGDWGGCDVWLGFDGTSYVKAGTITEPAVQGLLTAPLAAYAGANPDTGDMLAVDCSQSGAVPQPVAVADAQMLRTLSLVAAQPTPAAGAFIVPSNGEMLAFGNVVTTGINTANLSYLERGQYGSSPNAHAAGDQFTLIDVLGSSETSVSFDLPAAYIGATLYLKLAAFNVFGNATQDLSDCVEYQYVPTGAGYGSGAARTSAYLVLTQTVAYPFTSDSSSIAIVAYTVGLDDGRQLNLPAYTLTGLSAGTTYGVFYVAGLAPGFSNEDGSLEVNEDGSGTEEEMTPGGYIAVASPALAAMASSANVFLGWQTTLNADGSAPASAPVPSGYGGTGPTAGGLSNHQQLA